MNFKINEFKLWNVIDESQKIIAKENQKKNSKKAVKVGEETLSTLSKDLESIPKSTVSSTSSKKRKFDEIDFSQKKVLGPENVYNKKKIEAEVNLDIESELKSLYVDIENLNKLVTSSLFGDTENLNKLDTSCLEVSSENLQSQENSKNEEVRNLIETINQKKNAITSQLTKEHSAEKRHMWKDLERHALVCLKKHFEGWQSIATIMTCLFSSKFTETQCSNYYNAVIKTKGTNEVKFDEVDVFPEDSLEKDVDQESFSKFFDVSTLNLIVDLRGITPNWKKILDVMKLIYDLDGLSPRHLYNQYSKFLESQRNSTN